MKNPDVETDFQRFSAHLDRALPARDRRCLIRKQTAMKILPSVRRTPDLVVETVDHGTWKLSDSPARALHARGVLPRPPLTTVSTNSSWSWTGMLAEFEQKWHSGLSR